MQSNTLYDEYAYYCFKYTENVLECSCTPDALSVGQGGEIF